jgi:hypothetical protein
MLTPLVRRNAKATPGTTPPAANQAQSPAPRGKQRDRFRGLTLDAQLLAAAGPALLPAARCRAPGTAGRRSGSATPAGRPEGGRGDLWTEARRAGRIAATTPARAATKVMVASWPVLELWMDPGSGMAFGVLAGKQQPLHPLVGVPAGAPVAGLDDPRPDRRGRGVDRDGVGGVHHRVRLETSIRGRTSR